MSPRLDKLVLVLVPVLLLACAGAGTRPTQASSGCAVPESMIANETPAAVKVDGATAKRLVAEGARLIDVRAPDFYAGGHIRGAVNIPVARVAARAAEEIGPVTTPVVLYCRTGAGSARAAVALKQLGYLHVYDLGSYLRWGEGAPPPTPLPAATTKP